MSSTIFNIVPRFNGPRTADAIKLWLSQCEDAFDIYEDTHPNAPNCKLSNKTCIRVAGSALQEKNMLQWWADERDELTKICTWEKFKEALNERWIPSTWKIDAREKFYGCVQGDQDFEAFKADLQYYVDSINKPPAFPNEPKDPPTIITVAMHKHHLLFYCHPQLYRRVIALPKATFDIDEIEKDSYTVQMLVDLLNFQWKGLVSDSGTSSSAPKPRSRSALFPSTPNNNNDMTNSIGITDGNSNTVTITNTSTNTDTSTEGNTTSTSTGDSNTG